MGCLKCGRTVVPIDPEDHNSFCLSRFLCDICLRKFKKFVYEKYSINNPDKTKISLSQLTKLMKEFVEGKETFIFR